MPVTLTYPGVYVQELENPVRPIVGVQTSVAAFVGSAPRGRTDFPVQVNSWADYERAFGTLDAAFPLSYAVYLFFLNGGSNALVVRSAEPSADVGAATLPDKDGNPSGIKLVANSPGKWGESLSASVDAEKLVDPAVNKFNLTITEKGGAVETYRGLNLDKSSPRYVGSALAGSQLVNFVNETTDHTKPPDPGKPAKAAKAASPATPAVGNTPAPPGTPAAPAEKAEPKVTSFRLETSDEPIHGTPPLGDELTKTGMYALGKADIFNILCFPVDPGDPETALDQTTLASALEFCEEHRAMLVVDPPTAWANTDPLDFDTVTNTDKALISAHKNAAIYYPNVIVSDGAVGTLALGPCGAVAGMWAATDTARGIWKAPAGTAASLRGVIDLQAHIDDGESGMLNPLAVNCLRTLPQVGPVSWGARTSVGGDMQSSQWKYIPVRRTALFIEESLRRGTQWVVFEPNDEPLWSSIRLNIGAFMQGLFRQGAFQGSTPAEAYIVKCDKDNNPQQQIDLGIVNILVGFAPLKPAEFVIISIQQLAGQAGQA